MMRSLLALALFLAAPFCAAAEPFFLHDGQRVVFLGDSNTFNGLYIAYVDGYLRTRFPEQKFELLNLGLPSETVSGLSEADHPYPRPDVHERLQRVLERTRPDVVVACYGMNDGIYSPFSEDRFKKYQEGMQRLIERVQKAGARVVLMTPPSFDPVPLQDKVLPLNADRFSWMKPYEGYDDVLKRYSEWLLTLRDQGLPVADVHNAVNRYLSSVRKSEPRYRLAADGIHPDATGHALIAEQLLLTWHAPAEVDSAEIDAGFGTAVQGQVSDVAIFKGMVRFTWLTRLPMPHDPKWDPRVLEKAEMDERLNRQVLTVGGAREQRYELFEGEHRLGEVSGEQLAAGVNLVRYPELSGNRRSIELGKLVEERERLVGLAWLTDIGHKRPDTPKGLPLEEAQRRAAALEERLRPLAEPVRLTLRLMPTNP